MNTLLLMVILFMNTINPKYYNIILEMSKKFNVEPEIIMAVIKWESNWNEKAYLFEKNVNDYSVGLMQVRYDTAKSMGFTGKFEELFDPYINIYYGTRYLKSRLDKYSDLPFKIQIATYNSGSPLWTDIFHTRVKNQNYADIVYKYYIEYKNMELPKDPIIEPIEDIESKKIDNLNQSIIFGLILGIIGIYLYIKLGGKK